ncbi:TIGR02206 family membrane protein [Salipaludibacillus sp. HK11]|uniref:YwaF family protein n=1 Tax=Salipaludibacillus sp. HK11 TaxID=3394320 RepID=UPI0039FD7A4A
MWFGGSSSAVSFTMYSFQHVVMIALLIGVTLGLYLFRLDHKRTKLRKWEITVAISLIVFEVTYQIWLIVNGNWHVSHALPLELSNISVILVIVLLLTRSKFVFELVFLVGIGGALQAILTPVLTFGWPHFRFLHFFYTHLMVIWVAFYYLWVKGLTFSFVSVLKAMLFLNVLLPVIYVINTLIEGNYWFIMEKPVGGSILDFLGPHPWYIVGMELAAFVFFSLLWLLFGQKNNRSA